MLQAGHFVSLLQLVNKALFNWVIFPFLTVETAINLGSFCDRSKISLRNLKMLSDAEKFLFLRFIKASLKKKVSEFFYQMGLSM